LFFTLIAMVSSVFVITDFVLDQTVAFILSGATAIWFITFWGALPYLRRNWIDEDAEEEFPDE
jgi:intracellular septation protein A